jgi:GxxExxY protein
LNHEGHEGHEEHEEKDMRLKVPSDLPEDLEELIRAVIGAAIEVHRHLGPGFIESIYEQSLCHELSLRGIKFERQKEIVVNYKGLRISGQRLDILVEGRLILELKSVEEIAPIHVAQLVSYLKSNRLRAGLLINFNVQQLKSGIHRVVV